MTVNEAAEFARVKLHMRFKAAIFVFGSNLAGIHGAGAARDAVMHYGAIMRQGVGLQGRSYAIPTKDHSLQTLLLKRIASHVDDFIEYATLTPDRIFIVTRIGCGLASYPDEDIAPMFLHAPKNCELPVGWREFNKLK